MRPLESVTVEPVVTVATLAGKMLLPSSPKTVAGLPVATSIRVIFAPSMGAPVALLKTMPKGSTAAEVVEVSLGSAMSV